MFPINNGLNVPLLHGEFYTEQNDVKKRAHLLQRSLFWTAPRWFPSTAKKKCNSPFSSLLIMNSYMENEKSEKAQTPSPKVQSKVKAY